MREELTLILKDFRRFWLLITCACGALAFQLYLFYRNGLLNEWFPIVANAKGIHLLEVSLFWVFVIIALIPAVILEDTTNSKDAFLATRPLGASTIGLSKLLIIVGVCVLLPALAQNGILYALGMAAVRTPEILLEEVIKNLLIVMPFAVIAARSRSVLHYLKDILILGLIMAFLVYCFSSMHSLAPFARSTPSFPREQIISPWILIVTSIVTIGFLVVLYFDCFRRHSFIPTVLGLLATLAACLYCHKLTLVFPSLPNAGATAEAGSVKIEPAAVRMMRQGPVANVQRLHEIGLELQFKPDGQYISRLRNGRVKVISNQEEIATAQIDLSYSPFGGVLTPEELSHFTGKEFKGPVIEPALYSLEPLLSIPPSAALQIVSRRMLSLDGTGTFDVYKIEKIFQLEGQIIISESHLNRQMQFAVAPSYFPAGSRVVERSLNSLFSEPPDRPREITIYEKIQGTLYPTTVTYDLSNRLVIIEIRQNPAGGVYVEPLFTEDSASWDFPLWPRRNLEKRLWKSRGVRRATDIPGINPADAESIFLGLRVSFVGQQRAKIVCTDCKLLPLPD